MPLGPQDFSLLFFLFTPPIPVAEWEVCKRGAEWVLGCKPGPTPQIPIYATDDRFQATGVLARPLHHGEPKFVAYSEFLQNTKGKLENNKAVLMTYQGTENKQDESGLSEPRQASV